MTRVQVVRGVIPPIAKSSRELEIWTTCGPDDQFTTPNQCNWNAVLGKLQISGEPFHIRNADLSFFSKCYLANRGVAANDSDSANSYYAFYGAASSLYQSSIFPLSAYVRATTFPLIRMIDAVNLATHVLVTSNSGTDHHGLRLVRKSDMTVPAGLSLLADGSGNGQFDDPLGVKYYDGKAYVCDFDNSRIQVIAIDLVTPALTYDSQYALGYKPYDLCNDGVNWYVLGNDGKLYKYDMSFTDATKTSVSVVGYSLCIIPDQSDGYGATLCIVDSTNSHIERRKCSDLSAINSVGSSGDGLTSLFDLTFTTSVPTTITYLSDDGFVYTTPAGTSHALSWNGFAGYTHRSPGPHRWTIKCPAGLGVITEIDCNTDLVTSIKNLSKCVNLTSFKAQSNSGLVLAIGALPWKMVTLWAHGCGAGVTGSVRHMASLTALNVRENAKTTAEVDAWVEDLWANRAVLTTPTINMNGSNQAPTGTFQYAETPSTPKEKIYSLINDYLWLVYYTT